MHSETENELTSEERSMLAALPRRIEPGLLLEEKVVRALRREGSFARRPARRNASLRNVLKIAAAIALFSGGVATGRYLFVPGALQTSSTNRIEPVRQSDSGEPGGQPIPASGETIVAEREIWM